MAGMGSSGPTGFPGAPGSLSAPANRAVADSDTSRGAAREGESPKPGAEPNAVPPKRRIGGAIHEVGTARMTSNPKDGVLNSYCQTHDIPNLYVFGGNAFPSTGDKHPTLTMLALTARGCDHLLESAKRRGA